MLECFGDGKLTVDQVLDRLKILPYEDLGFAKVDHHRTLRKGFPEVVFGQGKTPEQLAEIVESLLRNSDKLLVTKAEIEVLPPLAQGWISQKCPKWKIEQG